jgi:hypothetical protein
MLLGDGRIAIEFLSTDVIFALVKRYEASIADDGRVVLWDGPENDVAFRDRTGKWTFGRKALVPTADDLKDNYRPCINPTEYEALRQEARKAHASRYEAVFGRRAQPA